MRAPGSASNCWRRARTIIADMRQLKSTIVELRGW
jgi:hypothetical protein